MITTVATVIITGFVPPVVRITDLDKGTVHIEANVPIKINGVTDDCNVTDIPVDKVCSVVGPITVEAI